MTKLEITEHSTIAWDNETLSVKDWAERRGLPIPFAIQALKAWLKEGSYEIEAKVHLRLAGEKTAPQSTPEPRRRGRGRKAMAVTQEASQAASESKDGNATAPANPIDKRPENRFVRAVEPKRSAAEVDAEMTWDARARAYGLLSQPWGDEWGPPPESQACLCPRDILQRYGIAA